MIIMIKEAKHMNEKGTVWPTVAIGVIACILGLCIGLLLAPSTPADIKFPTAQEIADKVVVPVNPAPADINNSKLDEIYTETFKDDQWETEATALATDEWSDNDYKDLFNAMVSLNLSINDRDDINDVNIEDDAFDGDTEDKDASVVQELEVKYESSTGDHLKAYLTVTTEIDENEVDTQVVTLTA